MWIYSLGIWISFSCGMVKNHQWKDFSPCSVADTMLCWGVNRQERHKLKGLYKVEKEAYRRQEREK